jgi:hypothetical protein
MVIRHSFWSIGNRTSQNMSLPPTETCQVSMNGLTHISMPKQAETPKHIPPKHVTFSRTMFQPHPRIFHAPPCNPHPCPMTHPWCFKLFSTFPRFSSPPLEIGDEVQKDFILVHKKFFMKYGDQTIKQVSKSKKIFECTTSLKPIIWKKWQHNGIGPHLFYLNLQHCNVSLRFNKIQLTIVKCSQNISLIFNVELKSSLY